MISFACLEGELSVIAMCRFAGKISKEKWLCLSFIVIIYSPQVPTLIPSSGPIKSEDPFCLFFLQYEYCCISDSLYMYLVASKIFIFTDISFKVSAPD